MKTYFVVMIAALSASVGESFLSFGMKRYGSLDLADPSQWLVLVSSVVTNRYVFLGIIFLAVFFFLYLAALSWADLSFVLPLTAVSYLFAALLSKFFLKEEVSWNRWIGTIVIVIGIALVALDGAKKTSTGHQTPGFHAGVPGNHEKPDDAFSSGFPVNRSSGRMEGHEEISNQLR